MENRFAHCRQLFINNEFVPALQGDTFEVVNPATGGVITTVASALQQDTDRAIAAATKAFSQYRLTAAATRSQWLLNWASLILENKEPLARLMSSESGKPITEARGEVDYSLGYLHWFAAECLRAQGQQLPQVSSDKWMYTLMEPVGVCATITPWNFPLAMAMRKWAPAIAAGCAVVAKPATETPLTLLAVASLYAEAKLPPGLLQVMPTAAFEAMGEQLCADERIAKLSFTGSTATGRKLMAQCSPTLKRLSMELGGNAPLIVCADADLKTAVQGTMKAKFRNGGQSCVAANRIYVHRDLAEAFIDGLETVMKTIVQTDPMDEQCTLGALVHERAVVKVETLVEDAITEGAKCLAGGQRPAGQSLFYPPTLLTNCERRMKLHNTEIFGPVAAVYVYDHEEEAVAWANESPYGLVAYLFTQSAGKIDWFQRRLVVGMLGINTGLISHAEVPFGGVKQSGFGREGGYAGLAEYQQLKYVCQGLPTPNPGPFPTSPTRGGDCRGGAYHPAI